MQSLGQVRVKSVILFIAILSVLTLAASVINPVLAEDAKPADLAQTEAKPPASDIKESGALSEAAILTPEEKAEKEARKACKSEICSAFRNPTSAGRQDITCDVMKSWRKEQLVKMVARMKVTWPYGPVRCTSSLKLKRDDLAKAMSEPKHESQLEKHAVSCEVDRDKEPKAEIKFEFSPKVAFEKGKAISAKMNWGKVDGPALIKGAFWTATAADNTVNMLSGTLVEDINDFIGKKCDEVKDEAAPK